jgi:predicted XRE-type DNA-binding protein
MTAPKPVEFLGKIDLFSLDALVNMASTAGLHVAMHISDAA